MKSFIIDIKNKKPEQTKVMVAMSGGVDSSVVAAYLHHLGYQVIGVTLQLYYSEQKSFKKTCCAGQDIFDAKKVAAQFSFAHYVVDMQKTFEKEVMEEFADSYLKGQTPVPCIKCNQTVKFRDLFKIAKDLNVDALATGHYVKRVEKDNEVELHRGFDTTKDQSYFLFATTRDQLRFLRFPLGDLTKEQTRKLATDLKIAVYDKPESQDICFVKSKSYVDVINKLRPQSCQKGNIVYLDGKVLGVHNGIVYYTVGQRHGLNVSYHHPLYVIKIDRRSNTVTVGPKSALEQNSLYIKEINWLDKSDILDGMSVSAKLRSGANPVDATLYKSDDFVKVQLLHTANCAIAPGQACVLYKGSRVLGGGWITDKTD